MTIRSLNSALKTSLMNYDPFIVAHLVKFEKPQNVAQYGGEIQGIATDYTYITDAQHDIVYDDGSTDKSGNSLGAQNYRANKVLSLGTVNENIQAKASNMSLVLDSASLGATATTSATFTTSEMAGDVDLSAEGFQEGDKILLSGSGNTNDGAYVRIDSFKNDGKTITFTQISSISANATAQTYTITLSAEEINVLLTDKTSSSYTNYINREVLIYKVHINPETRAIIGAPYLYFKGITSGASIEEKLDSSKITWTLSSHWGDFVRVQGRLTDDSSHRALNIDGTPDLTSVIKPAYAGDLGFIHSNTAINHLATYQVMETRYKMKKRGGVAGAIGMKKVVEYEVEVDRHVNLQFNPQAKMLPVVYGVRKLDSFPVFVDTHKDRSNEVYKLDAICEGKIAGLLDIYIEDNPTICLDQQDFDTRNSTGTNYNAETVEMQCYGRADRGDTLTEYTAYDPFDMSDYQWEFDETLGVAIPTHHEDYFAIEFDAVPTGTTNAEVGDATGLLHQGTHSIKSPIDADLTLHQGLEDQKADNTLVALASDNNFKIQNSYYPTDAKNPYWSPSHRLLDTAYVLGKYTIAEGETTLPELKYIVRGRDPECYNYDGSYKHDSTYTSDASVDTFDLGDTVTLKKVNGNMTDQTVEIIDKWSTFDSDGIRDHRFRFSPAPSLGTTTAFYMDKSGSEWHMQTWDHSEGSDNPAADLYNSSFSVATGTSFGLKVTFTAPSTAFEWAISNSNAEVGVWKSGAESLLASTFKDFSYTASTNVLDNITHFTSDPGIQRVYVKNAIQLDSGSSSSNDYYNGNKITLTDSTGTTPYIQERTIIDYDGTTKVAIVDAPWDWNYQPKTTDTYSIGSIGDKRVTINPAMQLLDYITNKRYGKGLDIDKEINIDSWLQAARECDTRSDVTMAFSSSASFSVGEKWRYPQTGAIQWKGTVSKVETLGGKKQITFTDIIGKLGTKWNSYKTFASGELYWYDGNVYSGTGAVVSTAPTGAGLSSVTLYKVGGGSVGIDISTASANGNPLIKKYSTVTGTYTASGYSLYDSDEIKYWRYIGWDDAAQRNVTRHQMNQIVETTSPIFDNINRMLTQFNGILKYVEGKYSLEIKGKKGTVDSAEQITDADIIGTIKVSDKGLKDSKNFVSASIIDPANKFEARNVSFFNSDYLKEDKGIQKKGQFSLPGITNYFNARFNIKQYLDESRYGLTIQFTMAPRGLLLTAGSIIELTYERFGYSAKEFRITNINFKKDGTVDIVADEHNDSAYIIPESAGSGFGVVEQPESGGSPEPLPIPARPTGLTCTQTNQGEIVLAWNNSSAFSSATHLVEIYRSSVNDFTNTTDPISLVGTSATNSFHDPIGEGEGNQTRYYWIRYMVRTPRLNLAGTDFRNVPSLYFPNTSDSGYGSGEGIEGIGQSSKAVRFITIDPGTTTNFVYQNDGTGIQSGYDTDTTLTTTKVNDAGTVTYKWYKDGVEISGATNSSYTYTPPNAFTDMPETIKVEMTDDLGGGNTITATDAVTFTATKIVVDGTDGYTVNPTNGTHNFAADSTGAIDDVSSFSTTFTVVRGNTTLSYDASGSPASNTYSYGTIGNVTPASSVTPVNTNGTITINASTGNFLTGTSVTQASFDVPIVDNDTSNTIATFTVVLSKSIAGSAGAAGVRGGSVFTFEESTEGNIDATAAAAYAGTLTNSAAQAVAAAVIAAASDSTIRPNDRITVTDNSADKAGTRVYTGSATSTASTVGTGAFSSLVVETFDGSVIVDGTLSANKINGGTISGDTVTVGSTMVLNTDGAFYTSGKTTYSDPDPGFFLGYDSTAHKLNLGDSSNYVKWDGSSLSVAGTMTISGTSTIDGTAASTVKTGAAAGATASQVNKGLALLLNQDSLGTSNNGECGLVGVDKDGVPETGTNGFIIYNGSKITVERTQYSSYSILTQIANKRGFICFDANKTEPFTMSGTFGDNDAAFVWKEGDQWYYDNNSTAVSFTPSSITGTQNGTDGTTSPILLAIGFLETATADSILTGGLFEPIELESAPFAGDTYNSGTIGGIEITGTYIQSSNFSAGSAGFKLASNGDFEAGNGTFRGAITATSGSIADSVTIGGTAASTVADAHTLAGSTATTGARTKVTSDGLIVIDSSGNTRVKIGDLSSL